MMSRGFFSAFVASFAIILIISFFQSYLVQEKTAIREAEVGVLQQSLSKDWFLLRNALTNFASEAILESIETNFSPGPSSCAIPSATDYAPDINAYWDDVVTYMNGQFGVNCDVNLSGDLQRSLEGPSAPINEIRSRSRGYGLLSCTRSSGVASLSITRPFVIRKDVRTTLGPGGCTVRIFDILGDNPSAGIPFERLDVEKTYP